MADEKKGPQEEKIFSKLKDASGQAPTGLTSFTGLLARGSKAGYWRLYLGLDMSKYVEINEEDIVHTEQLPADRSPFGSLGGTQVFVKKDAKVTTTQTSSTTKDASAAAGEFDLDIRLGGQAASIRSLPRGIANTFKFCTKIGGGPGGTCETCHTQCQDTRCAGTCQTQCDQNTCGNTCHTCQTHCGQPTCANTCTCPGQTQCGTCPGDTCVGHTCLGSCNVDTCVGPTCCGNRTTCAGRLCPGA